MSKKSEKLRDGAVKPPAPPGPRRVARDRLKSLEGRAVATFRIEVAKEFWLRVWLAKWLLRLACMALCCEPIFLEGGDDNGVE